MVIIRMLVKIKQNVICLETSDEPWVQCLVCEGWAHIECTGSENIDFFVCDHCQQT